MSRCPERRLVSLAPLLSLLAVAGAAPARPDEVIDVAGGVVAIAPRLEVRVTLTNRGDRAAAAIEVEGELAGERSVARLPGPLAPGASADVRLGFLRAPSRPGLHALTMLIEHPVEGPADGAGNPPVASQRAWLLLAFETRPDEAVSIEAAPLALEVRGSLGVRLSSRDGEPHRVRLRALTARGLRADAEWVDVAIPKAGSVKVELEVVRAGASPGSRQALLLVAETLDDPVSRATVAAATVEVRPDPAIVPRVRVALFVVGMALVGAALAFEARHRARARRALEA